VIVKENFLTTSKYLISGEKIQTGLFLEDTIEANDFFYHHYNLEKLILVGSCGVPLQLC